MDARESFTSRIVITPLSATEIIQLPKPTSFNMPDKAIKVSEVIEITNFKARAVVKSLQEAQLPDFSLEDSQTDRLRKSLNIEWNSPRIQLNLFVGLPEDWNFVGSLSLLNPMGYPYRVYDLLALYAGKESAYIGNNVSLGIGIEDVGYGGLKLTDRIDVHAEFIRHISYFACDTVTVNQGNLVNNINIPSSTSGTTNNTGNDDNNGNDDDNNSPNTGDNDEMPLKIVSYTTPTNAVNRDRILVSFENPEGEDNIAIINLPSNPVVGTEVDIISGGSRARINFTSGTTYRGGTKEFLAVGNQIGNVETNTFSFGGGKLIYGYAHQYGTSATWFPLANIDGEGKVANQGFGVEGWLQP